MRPSVEGSGASLGKIAVHVRNEYDRLVDVVWGPITETNYVSNFFALGNFPTMMRKVFYNSYRPFNNLAAAAEHRGFRQTLCDQGANVHDVDIVPGLFAQYGTRDAGFVVDDIFIPSRPHRPHRQKEVLGLRRLIPRLSKVGWLDFGHIEGGDVVLDDEAVLVGLGEATNLDGVDALRHVLALNGNGRPVVPITFSHQGIVHLDTSLGVLGKNLALCYAPNFAPDSLRELERRFELVAVTKEEFREIRVNVVALGEGRVIVKAGSDRIEAELVRRGMVPVPVVYDEVTAFPGSFRCTTLPLARAS